MFIVKRNMEITKHLFRSKFSLSIPYCSKILLCYLKPAFNGLLLFFLRFQFNLIMMHVQSKAHKTIFWQMGNNKLLLWDAINCNVQYYQLL